MATNIQTWLLEAERKEYQEDALKWLHKRFGWIIERINEQSEWQTYEARSFVQNASESLTRSLMQTRDSLILWLGIVALIALASAGLWIGVGGVALLVIGVYWRNRLAWKTTFRLDRFRHRFRELLRAADDREMLAEDKEFLRKYTDSILYPYAVANEHPLSYRVREHLIWPNHRHGREAVSAADLWRVETLYREYCGYSHSHPWPDPQHPEYQTEDKCQLCMARRRVREHIEGVLSKFEAAIESAHQTLITQIDSANPQGAVRAKDFLEDYREWERLPRPEDSEAQRDDKLRPFPLLEALRDKACWTFEEADKVRELCRKAEIWKDKANRVFDKLSHEMEAAAVRGGLEQAWKLYEWKSWFLQVGSTSSPIRRIIGRYNPEAMFRELREDVGLLGPWRGLGALTSYGYDSKLVARECRTGEKLIARERGKLEEKCYKRELAAAQAFARVEGLVREQRERELHKAIDADLRRESRWEKLHSVAFRLGRAVGRLLGSSPGTKT